MAYAEVSADHGGYYYGHVAHPIQTDFQNDCPLNDTVDDELGSTFDDINSVESFEASEDEPPSYQNLDMKTHSKLDIQSTAKLLLRKLQQWQSMCSLPTWIILSMISKLCYLAFICLMSITCWIWKNKPMLIIIMAMPFLPCCFALGDLQPQSSVLVDGSSSECFQIEMTHQLWDNGWDLTYGDERHIIYRRMPERTLWSDLNVTCHNEKCSFCLSKVKYNHSGLYCLSFLDNNSNDKCWYFHVISTVTYLSASSEYQFHHSGPKSRIRLQRLHASNVACTGSWLTDQTNLMKCRSYETSGTSLLFEVENPVDKAATNIAVYKMGITYSEPAKASGQFSASAWWLLVVCALVSMVWCSMAPEEMMQSW